MAVNDTRLNVTEFDFDDVKDNLKIFVLFDTLVLHLLSAKRTVE